MSARMIPMKNRVLRFCSVVLLVTASPIMADWEKLPSMLEPSGGFACGADHDGITVLGGTNWENGEKHWLQNVSHFDPGTKKWEIIGRLSEPVAYGACGLRQGADGRQETFMTLGGSNGRTPVKALAVMDGAKTVLQPVPALPDKIVLCAGGIVRDSFIIAGGTDDAPNLEGLTKRTYSLDLTKRNVAPLPDFPGKPFGTAASAVVGAELFIFGGANWDEAHKTVANTAESYAFSAGRKQWRKLKPYPLAVRGATAVALDEHRIYIAGGYGGDPEHFLADAFIYDVRTDLYAKAAPLPYAATVGLVKLDGFVYCLGGEDQMKHRTNAAWRIRVKELTK